MSTAGRSSLEGSSELTLPPVGHDVNYDLTVDESSVQLPPEEIVDAKAASSNEHCLRPWKEFALYRLHAVDVWFFHPNILVK
jgi:hypothetical protein